MFSFFNADIVHFMSNSVPTYTLKANSIVCEYIDERLDCDLLNDFGINRINRYIDCECFYDTIIKEIDEESPILIATYSDGQFDRFSLINGYSNDGFVTAIQQRYPQSLTYAEEVISIQEVKARHLDGNDFDKIKASFFKQSIKYQSENSVFGANKFFGNCTKNHDRLVVGVSYLNDFVESITEIVEYNERTFFTHLIEDLNNIINSCSVTIKILSEHNHCWPLIYRKKRIKDGWCYVRNKLMKSKLSGQKITNVTSLSATIERVANEEQRYVDEIVAICKVN